MDPLLPPTIAVSRSRRGLVVLAVAFIALIAIRYLAFGTGQVNFSAPVNLPISELNTQLRPEQPFKSQILFGTAPLAYVSNCNLENINGAKFDATKTVYGKNPITLNGWVVDPKQRDAAELSWIEFVRSDEHDDFVAPIHFRIRRSDVQELLHGRRGYAMAGFISKIDTSLLPSGAYHLLVVYKSSDSYYLCDNGRNIVLKDDGTSR